jgi:potassium channel subfamily K, other eukaryote
VGVAVGMCRETVLEGLEVGYRKRVASLRRKRKEMRRRRLVEGRWRGGIEQRLRAKGEPVWVKDDLTGEKEGWGWKKTLWKAWEALRKAIGMKKKKHHDFHHHHHHHGGMHLNLDALTPAELEAAALGAGVPLDELLPADYMVARQKRKQRETRGSLDGRSSVSSEDVGIEERIRRGLRSTDANRLTQARMGGMVAMLGRFALAVQAHGGEDGNGFHIHEDDVSEHHHHGVELEPTMTMMTAGNESGHGTPTQNLESFRKGVEKEERRAFMARFVVAWTLFVVFWVVRIRFINVYVLEFVV